MNAQDPVGYFSRRAFFCLPRCGLLFYCLLFYFSNSTADSSSPFLSHNQNPLVMIYGLPLPTAAKIIAANTSHLSASLNVSNTINVEASNNESLFVDAETYQLNLLLEYGLNKSWMLRFQLPLVAHNAGFLDSWIDDYHDLLSLPESIRPLHPIDRLQINYQLSGNTLVNIQQRTSGIGDISMQLGYQATTEKDFNISYWGSLKLPTGEAQQLTGSGSTDLAFWLSTDAGLKHNRWLYASLGIMYIAGSEVMPSIQKNTVLFATAGFQMQPWESILLKLQLDSHSAFYRSEMEFLGDVLQVTFGGTILLASSSIDIAISEDILPQTSPDVTFNISWKIRY
jgi:hypothetical protein